MSRDNVKNVTNWFIEYNVHFKAYALNALAFNDNEPYLVVWQIASIDLELKTAVCITREHGRIAVMLHNPLNRGAIS